MNIITNMLNKAINDKIKLEENISLCEVLSGVNNDSNFINGLEFFREKYSETSLSYPGDQPYFDMLFESLKMGLSVDESITNISKYIISEFEKYFHGISLCFNFLPVWDFSKTYLAMSFRKSSFFGFEAGKALRRMFVTIQKNKTSKKMRTIKTLRNRKIKQKMRKFKTNAL